MSRPGTSEVELAAHAEAQWTVATGQLIGQPPIGQLGSLDREIRSVAFSTDGQHVLSGGADHLVCLWDAATGQPLGAAIAGHTDMLNSVAFSPDLRWIISSGADNTIRRWPGPTAWHDTLCGKLTTNMSYKQWREWVSPDIEYIRACADLPIAPD